MHRSIRALLAPLAALCCFALPVVAESISGSLSGDATLTATGTPGVYTQNFSGDGIDASLGGFSIASMSTVDFSSPPNIGITDGTFTETFAGGKLFGTSSGDGRANGAGFATTTIDLLFTGGTGEFAGVTGEATFTGNIFSTGPTTESINGTYVGKLNSFPEPSSLPILAFVSLIILGYGLAAPRLRRRREDHGNLPNS